MDYCILGCEIIFILFLFYYLIEELVGIKEEGYEYFKDFWNLFDDLILLMGFVCIFLNVYRLIEVERLVDGLLRNEDQYANFEELRFSQNLFDNVLALAVFVAWIKVTYLHIEYILITGYFYVNNP